MMSWYYEKPEVGENFLEMSFSSEGPWTLAKKKEFFGSN